jgi:hypothetical protein
MPAPSAEMATCVYDNLIQFDDVMESPKLVE